MRLRVLSITDVAERHLCCGCGACEYMSGGDIKMVDDLERGRRPLAFARFRSESQSAEALEVCPGISLRSSFNHRDPALIKGLAPAWGPVLEVWEGFASDATIRFSGSSGGAASALAIYCIERGGMHGLLHTAARPNVPYLNHTTLSTNRGQVLAATGSRYAPASPCDGLQMIEDAPARCVFIGKPCDVAATGKARKLRPALDDKLGLTIAVFCAGTPSSKGTLEMLAKMGITDLAAIKSIRYRGNGWPGKATVHIATPDGEITRALTYEQSWGEILQKHRQWRCYVCIDHSGEFADISVGDPWHRPIAPGDPGQSLILVRTERGRRILEAAMEAGFISARRADPEIIEKSQPGFPTVRGQVWARILACRLMGVAAPRYQNMPMFRFWWSRLSAKEKVRSLLGTARRVFRKKLRHRAKVEAYQPPSTQISDIFANC